jgi:hypothetical protein
VLPCAGVKVGKSAYQLLTATQETHSFAVVSLTVAKGREVAWLSRALRVGTEVFWMIPGWVQGQGQTSRPGSNSQGRKLPREHYNTPLIREWISEASNLKGTYTVFGPRAKG